MDLSTLLGSGMNCLVEGDDNLIFSSTDITAALDRTASELGFKAVIDMQKNSGQSFCKFIV